MDRARQSGCYVPAGLESTLPSTTLYVVLTRDTPKARANLRAHFSPRDHRLVCKSDHRRPSCGKLKHPLCVKFVRVVRSSDDAVVEHASVQRLCTRRRRSAGSNRRQLAPDYSAEIERAAPWDYRARRCEGIAGRGRGMHEVGRAVHNVHDSAAELPVASPKGCGTLCLVHL